MYTENNNEVYDEYYEGNSNNTSNNKLGLIIKILIIIVCVIILIWLILKLKNNSNKDVVYDPSIHASNVEKVRLGAEEYFFNQGNLPKKNEVKKVSLESLNKENLVGEIVDANQKVCNDLKSIVSMEENDDVYELKIKLSCSTSENEEIFYYKKDNYSCLNCNGVTRIKVNNDKKDETSNHDSNNTSDNDYSCSDWSSWTSTRSNDPSLKERIRKVYLGIKRGTKEEKNIYSEWSEYTTTPIVGTDDIEIEKRVETEEAWGEIKTSNTEVLESDKVKVVSTSTVGGGSYTYCPKGYNEQNNKCVSETLERGDLEYLEYNSGNYYIENKPCDRLNTVKNSSGTFDFVYINCLYRKVIDKKTGYSSSSTVYNYQEKEMKEVTYYRYRTIKRDIVTTNDEYTDRYYTEDTMPNGFEKVDTSMKEEYSYMINVCEK